MNSAPKHRRPAKVRRTGRHAAPSQLEKAAEKADKAAPAVAIAGILVAGPAHAAVAAPVTTVAVAEQIHTLSFNDIIIKAVALALEGLASVWGYEIVHRLQEVGSAILIVLFVVLTVRIFQHHVVAVGDQLAPACEAGPGQIGQQRSGGSGAGNPLQRVAPIRERGAIDNGLGSDARKIAPGGARQQTRRA